MVRFAIAALASTVMVGCFSDSPAPTDLGAVDAGGVLDGYDAGGFVSTPHTPDAAMVPDDAGDVDVASPDAGSPIGRGDAGAVIRDDDAATKAPVDAGPAPSEDAGPQTLCCTLTVDVGTYCGCQVSPSLSVEAECKGSTLNCSAAPGVCATGDSCTVTFPGGTSAGGTLVQP